MERNHLWKLHVFKLITKRYQVGILNGYLNDNVTYDTCNDFELNLNLIS